MAGETSEEKTEKATPRRLRDARKKGEVSSSQDLTGSLSLVVGIAATLALMPWFATQIADLFIAVLQAIARPRADLMLALVLESFMLMLKLSLPVLLAVVLVAKIVEWLQVGPVFSVDPVIPKFENLNPVSGLKRIFSARSVAVFSQMLAKALIVGAAAFIVGWRVLPDAIRVIHADFGAALDIARTAVTQLLLWCGGIFVALGVADLAFQRWDFLKRQRMSMSEVKRERREDYGHQEVRSERNRLRHEPGPEEILKYVERSSLAVRHGDGRVVVIYHQAGAVPMYITRAAGDFAERVLDTCRERRIRQVQDDGLLDEMYSRANLGQRIDQEEVAQAVLRYLGR